MCINLVLTHRPVEPKTFLFVSVNDLFLCCIRKFRCQSFRALDDVNRAVACSWQSNLLKSPRCTIWGPYLSAKSMRSCKRKLFTQSGHFKKQAPESQAELLFWGTLIGLWGSAIKQHVILLLCFFPSAVWKKQVWRPVSLE